MDNQAPSSADTTAIEVAKQDIQLQVFLSEQHTIALVRLSELANQQTSSTSKKVSRIVDRLPEKKPKQEVPSCHIREDAWTYNEDQKEATEKKRRENRRDIDIRESND
jgi:hypothetical protein